MRIRIEVLKTKMMELESDLEQLTSGSGAVLKRNKGQQAMNQTTMASQPQSNMQPPQQVVSAKNQDINTTQPIDPPPESFSYCDWENDISEDELEEIIEKTLDDITIDHEIEQKLMTLLDKDE
jgi:hypothetical protein